MRTGTGVSLFRGDPTCFSTLGDDSPAAPPKRTTQSTMTAICFVCNLPILSHQVGLIWQGGNGWDDLVREQVEESTLRQRLGTGRRDSAAQITSISPPNEAQDCSPTNQRRRRSSLAQLTDILREWGGGGISTKSSRSNKLCRRETLADIAKSLPWSRQTTTDASHLVSLRKRRESSVDSGIRSQVSSKSRRDSAISDLKNDIARLWSKKDVLLQPQPPPTVISPTPRRGSGESRNSRRGSGESARSRRDSVVTGQSQSPGDRKHNCRHHRRRQSQQSVDGGGVTPTKYYRTDQRPSASSTDSAGSNTVREHLEAPRNSTERSERSSSFEAKTQPTGPTMIDTKTVMTVSSLIVNGKASVVTTTATESTRTTTVSIDTSPVISSLDVSPPTIVMSSVTPPAISPTAGSSLPLPGTSTSGSSSPVGSPNVNNTPTHPYARRDSTTQCNFAKGKEVSPSKLSRLIRQQAAIDESMPPTGRRGSQPTLSPDPDDGGRKARRDSLSPDSASYPRRRDSKSHLSPDRTDKRDISPIGQRKGRLRRQSTSMAGRPPRSPDSSSCSSREPSPCARAPDNIHRAPKIVRRQSTTEEILIARGFRRQSTTEEMIRCRNFRRQSSQSDDVAQRFRGRRDSSAQITDGTFASMTVETSSTLFDSSTQTEPSPLYDNNHYHEECLKCNSCGLNLTGPNQKRARRFKNQILCDLHFADVALMECSDFMQQLRSFKPQSLGCAVARRKSSTTLIFPLPPQACSDEFCQEFPHNLIATPGYWIECSRQQITSDTIWDESESEHEGTDPEQVDGRSVEERPSMLKRQDKSSCLFEAENETGDTDDPPRKKTTIEEQWEKNQGFELTSVEQETYEKYFYGSEHWNYFTNDEDLGPVILSIKQETLNNRDQFRILVRAISYTVHGLIPASCVFADRYNREEVVRSLGKEVNINPPLTLGQLPDTPEELLKLDQVFIKSELKVGLIYVQEEQYTEEEILDNNDNSLLFEEFLQILGDKIRLKGFDKYKGGLDTVHDLTGLYSVYTNWRGIEIMFHVSTLLPYEKHDPQKLQRKRHIGNDIVCVVFLEADNTTFSPACIKSHFLHTFILVRVSPRIKRKITRYEVSVVTRDEVGAYKPYLWEQSVFEKGPMFREWILTKIVNGERASYSAPKFARMQERTRSQMLEDIVANLANHAETGQIPKPYRRGSWRPIGHMRPSSPLLDSVRDQFEDYDQLAKDFTRVFLNNSANVTLNTSLFDVSFLVPGQQKQKVRFIGVRAILAVRSRVFQEMLYGIQAGFGSPQVPVAELLARPAPTLLSPQKPKSSNFLQVPDMESPRPKSVPSSPMVKRAFSRLGTITAGWGRSIRKHGSTLQSEDRKRWASSQDCSNKEAKDKDKVAQSLAVPRLSVCADAQKVDRTKLAQTEFDIIEFDPETFRILLDYLHTGSCPLTCSNIPGLICAAEHYDLPELLQACFHHAKQFLRVEIVCVMLCALENYYWRYTSASELVNMILAFIETRAELLFNHPDFVTLSESMVQMIMCRSLELAEVKKFEAMLNWAKHRIKTKSTKIDAKVEFKCIMDRLSRDLKLHKITPQELIRIVLPSKVIKNERILDTLMYQANSGIYRNIDSCLEAYQRMHLQDQESFDCGL
ncbi:LOW QUALITY PROTEIN: rap GTPase activating protein radish [Temnothorax americanus]|uniref:LOW QUALITY PROTEIN: rap GTPase activating protein radish n=1 Tax=Temnothorax americanus TaxID=1964332 RepID=UPI004069051E